MEQRARILIVGDQKGECDVLSYLLEGQGYEVDQAHDGVQALREIERRAYDLLLVDTAVSGPGGSDLLHEIREIMPDSAVIVVTSHDSLETALAAIQCHACDYLCNPLGDPDKVLAAVERGLSDHTGVLTASTITAP